MDLPHFKEINVSTKTILAKVNCMFNLEAIYQSLPLTHYEVVKKKRGRKKKNAPPVQNNNIPPGSIIMVKHKNEMRGVDRKNRKNKNTYMRNCVVVELILEDKFVNIKIFNNEKEGNGKFHITGCKKEAHAEQGVLYLWKHIYDLSKGKKWNDKLYYSIDNAPPSIIFKTSMTNIGFHLGFQVDRKKLNTLINTYQDFYSDFEPTMDTGVNITIVTEEPENFMLKCITIEGDDEPAISWVPKDEFKDKRDKEKNITFLVFQSGKCICSGPYYTRMEDTYNEFVKIIAKNRNKIQETIKF